MSASNVVRISLRIAVAAAAAVAVLLGVPVASGAAITVTPGANTVSTPKLELDFGDGAGNVERVDSLRWRNGAGALSSNVVAAGGAPPACTAGEPLEAFGQAYGWVNEQPVLVAAGSTGSLTVRGTRTVELNSSVPASCFNATVMTPVRTRYTFFDSGVSASKYRVERRFSFPANNPFYGNTQSLRAYVPRVNGTFSEVRHPNAAGTALVTDTPASCGSGCHAASWNGTWFAVNNPITNDGFVVLRDPVAAAPAGLLLDTDASSGVASSVDITQPGLGWTTPVTETEYLCFYDVASWPLAARAPNSLPPGCTAAAVPVNTAAASLSGTAAYGEQLAVSSGAWDGATGGFTYQWSRCDAAGESCVPIGGAAGATYTAGDADIGKRLRAAVTAVNGASGETDTITVLSGVVAGSPPAATRPPAITGAGDTPHPGDALGVDDGDWSPPPGSFAYTWLRCDAFGGACEAVPGASGKSYVIRNEDIGGTLRVRIVATGGGGPSAPVDSAQTAFVRRAPLKAALTVLPNPTCTGLETTFNGLASGPEVAAYRFEYTERQARNKMVTTVISNGSAGRVVHRFNWNRPSFELPPGVPGTADLVLFADWEARPVYLRDDVDVKLTVTDVRGATATTVQRVTFARKQSDAGSTGCVRAAAEAAGAAYVRRAITSVKAGRTSVSLLVPCSGKVSCVGVLSVTGVSVARASRARKPVYATVAFSVPAGKRQTISARYTRATLRELRRRKRLNAKATITVVDTGGRKVVHSKRVTLRRRR